MSIKKIIIDCDCGTDDAVALVLLISAHKLKKIEIKAITCVAGNAPVDCVVKNVFRTLQVCDSLDIPVYKGAHSSLISIERTVKAADLSYHGSDGFGDYYKDNVDISKLQDEHAVVAIKNIINKYPNEISVLCLAPLTNIALVIKMFPEILDNVKDFYAMGGNSTAKGNTTSQAEFNFYIDPESVHIVLESNKKPFWLLPWETCIKSTLTHDWRYNVLGKLNTKTIELINNAEKSIVLKAEKNKKYQPCDAIIAGIILDSKLIEEAHDYHADIELAGSKTRGQVVLDHLQTNKSNIWLIENINFDRFKELLLSAFDETYEPNILKTL